MKKNTKVDRLLARLAKDAEQLAADARTLAGAIKYDLPTRTLRAHRRRFNHATNCVDDSLLAVEDAVAALAPEPKRRSS